MQIKTRLGCSRGAQHSLALPYPFPNGAVWAAIKRGAVVNMVYMTQPDGEKVSYGVFRQRSRAALAKEGVVWSGRVRGGCFVPEFETTDIRHTGQCNTAREVG